MFLLNSLDMRIGPIDSWLSNLKVEFCLTCFSLDLGIRSVFTQVLGCQKVRLDT